MPASHHYHGGAAGSPGAIRLNRLRTDKEFQGVSK
jgi:hypothetical protein